MKINGPGVNKNTQWTINLKSFEIADEEEENVKDNFMNYKLEKFWNYLMSS